MLESWKGLLLWAPRILAIAYIAFLSLFALDVFGEEHGVGNVVLALMAHLIPSFVLAVALFLAWKWEWVGTVIYGLAGLTYVSLVLRLRIPPTTKVVWILTIAGPAFCVAALFLVGWIKRRELHPATP